MQEINILLKNILNATLLSRNIEEQRIIQKNLKELKILLKNNISENFFIKHSTRIGEKAAYIPWLMISDPNITKSPLNGFYLQFFFINNDLNKNIVLAYALSPTGVNEEIVPEERDDYWDYFCDESNKIFNELKNNTTDKELINEIVKNTDNIKNYENFKEKYWGDTSTNLIKDYVKGSIFFKVFELENILDSNIVFYINLFLEIYTEACKKNFYQDLKIGKKITTLKDVQSDNLTITKKTVEKIKEVIDGRDIFRENLKINKKEENFFSKDLSPDIATFPVSEKAHIIPVYYCVKKWKEETEKSEKDKWIKYISNPNNGLIIDPNTHSVLDKKNIDRELTETGIKWWENKKQKTRYFNLKYINDERREFIKLWQSLNKEF